VQAVAKTGRAWLWLAAIGIAALVLAQMPLTLNHDAAWHLSTAFRVTEGAEIGREVFDINPPMTAWLLSVPALVSNATGLSPTLAMRLFTLLVCLASIAASAALLLRLGFDGRRLSIATLFVAFALLALPGYEFTQREHLLAAMTLPYVLLAACRAERREVGFGYAMVVGLVAALAIGIKPHFLALPICVEAWLLFATRRPALALRPEMLAMAATAVSYVGAVAIFAPAYLTQVVPDALSNYDGFEVGPGTFLLRMAQELAVFIAAPAILLAGSRALPASHGLRAMLAALVGFMVAAILQGKGWSYQFLPAAVCAVVLLGLLVALQDFARIALAARAALLAALLFALFPPVINLVDGYTSIGTAARVARLEQVFRANPGPTGTVFAFITTPRDIHPAVLQSGLRWANEAGVMLYLPAMVREELQEVPSPDRSVIYATAERHNHQVVADLERLRPGVVVIDADPAKLGMEGLGFDYIEFFNRYPEFRRLWRNYAEAEPIGSFRIFLYRESIARDG